MACNLEWTPWVLPDKYPRKNREAPHRPRLFTNGSLFTTPNHNVFDEWLLSDKHRRRPERQAERGR